MLRSSFLILMRGCPLPWRPVFLLLLPILGVLGFGQHAVAHEIRPAIATLELADGGAFDLRLSLNLEALIAAIGPEHQDSSTSPNAAEYDRLRALQPAALEDAYASFADDLLAGISLLDASGNRVGLEPESVAIEPVGDISVQRNSVVTYSGRVPGGAASLRWSFDAAFGPSVIRAQVADGEIFYSDYVLNGEPSGEIELGAISSQSKLAVFADYVLIGFEHIVPKGLDHILFVVGLFLLSPRLKPLLWQVTCFTLAHSVTLALGMLRILRISPSIVEPLIALSIVYVAVENLVTDRLSRWRPLVIFLFGLLHGLGFAGVLTEIGLARPDFLVGLIAFNVGVELGQLAVIVACFLAVGLWFGHERWYRKMIAMPASLAIAAIGAFWFIERIA